MLGQTSTEKKHKHLVYLNQETGKGYTSVKQKHSHEIIFSPEDGIWVMAETDGHSHELYEYEPSLVKKEKETDEDKVAKVHALFRNELQVEEKFRKCAKESIDFLKGDQWDNSVKNKLHNEQRTAITINKIAAKCNLLSGFQRQNRTDLRFAPIEEGDDRMAKILDIIYKNIEDQNNYPQEESKIFEDQVNVGRGNFHVYMDFDEDVFGKIVIERINWDEVYYGSHEKYNLSDLEHMTKTKMFSVGKAKQMFPDKADKINSKFKMLDSFIEHTMPNPGEEYYEHQSSYDSLVAEDYGGMPLVDTEKKEIRVFEQYQKRYHSIYSLVRYEDGFVENIKDLTASQAKEWETVPGFKAIRRSSFEIDKVTVAGDTYIDEEVIDDYPIVPAYAHKIGNFVYGKIEQVKDPQRELNKRHSQAIDIINKCAAYNWIYDHQTFADARAEREFLANTSTPSYAIKVSNMQNQPVLTQGVRVPTEIVAQIQQASQSIDEIMNIPMEAQGFSEREFSGVALQEKNRQVQVANEFLFDNLNYAKSLVAKKVVKLIQEFYTPERIMRLVMNMSPATQEELMENQIDQQTIQELLANADLLKYDAKPIPSMSSATVRSGYFTMLFDLAKSGMDIPPELLIKFSDIPGKDILLNTLNQRAQAAGSAEKNKNDTEIIKSLPDEIQVQIPKVQELINGGQPQGQGQGQQLPPQGAAQ